MSFRPEILTHPNIPKPLHGVNPRTIMGQQAWDTLRREVYARYDYHCAACGVHKFDAKKHRWLEAHEYYSIDYQVGRVEIESIEPLCHYCHNFIHSGRMSMIIGSEKTKEEVVEILEHGFKILSEHHLSAFYYTIELADELGAQTFGVEASPISSEFADWADWRLVWDGNEYAPLFASLEDWEAHWVR